MTTIYSKQLYPTFIQPLLAMVKSKEFCKLMGKEKRLIAVVAVLIVSILLSGCAVRDVLRKEIRHKKYILNEKFINLKGIYVPEITPERLKFSPSKELKRDMRNSLYESCISKVYRHDDNAYDKAIKHHLISTTDVNGNTEYQAVIKDASYSKRAFKISNIITYKCTKGGSFESIDREKTQALPLNEEVFIGGPTNSTYVNKASLKYRYIFTYYPNGQLHYYKCSLLAAGFPHLSIDFDWMPIGVECNYDESGNLLASLDHEENFKMDFPALLIFVLNQRNILIEKYKKQQFGVRVSFIHRNSNALGSFWIVLYSGAKKSIYQIIDGNTGEIKDEFEYDEQLIKKYIEKPKEYTDKIKELRKI